MYIDNEDIMILIPAYYKPHISDFLILIKVQCFVNIGKNT